MSANRSTHIFGVQDLLDMLAVRISDAGSLRLCAQLLGVSPALLSRVMSGQLAVPPKLYKALGFQRRVVYEPLAFPPRVQRSPAMAPRKKKPSLSREIYLDVCRVGDLVRLVILYNPLQGVPDVGGHVEVALTPEIAEQMAHRLTQAAAPRAEPRREE